MAFKASLLLSLLLLSSSVTITEAVSASYGTTSLNRSSFPAGFIFGAASSAYQYEGAADEGGRGPSIWDTFVHKYPGKIKDRSNGDVAIDQYHRYKEDVGIIKEMNLDVYRLSISWTRILPKGKLSGGVNKKGINYYNNLINELLANGLQPFVTIFQYWDLPQTLEDEYGGFLSSKIVNDFRDFSELRFKEFGDRVKHWITLNEPWIFSRNGYAVGTSAPGRCSAWQNLNCTGGDSATEPYIVSHNQLLAHAAAVNVYKTKYQASQKGLIGITHACHWMVPLSNKKFDHHAAQRAVDFMFGWFMEPMTTGDYPAIMRSLVGNRLSKFSKQESKMLIGSFDFIGLNYYTANYAADAPLLINARPSYLTDSRASLSTERNGIPIGPRAASSWLHVYPKGLQDRLIYIRQSYDEFNDPKLSLEEALFDACRIHYHYQHLYYLLHAIKDGANVKGYFAWSLMDDFEWDSGYTVRFGINFVDYKNGFKRYPKLSSHWFKNLLRKY